MRHIALTSLLCACVAFPAAALAQEKATRSVEDYLCTFAGKCGDEAGEEEPTKVAPETKGFRLLDPKAPAPARQPQRAAPAQRDPTAVAARPGTPRPSNARPTFASAPKPAAAKAKPARDAVVQRRADLRLTFELGSATLTPQAMEEAKVFAESMKRPEMASMKFLIEGHTDSQGSRAYNIDLSQRRAQAVAEYLASLGVSSDRLEVRGYGFDRPLNGRSAAAEENRRVEAVLTS
jgi:outer membrane protein OmpA-like peptidoglycan-associated protein